MNQKDHQIEFVKNQTTYTDKVLGDLTDEMQKVHDLEHLLRKKEQQIEILRGDLDETRQLRNAREEYIVELESKN